MTKTIPVPMVHVHAKKAGDYVNQNHIEHEYQAELNSLNNLDRRVKRAQAIPTCNPVVK